MNQPKSMISKLIQFLYRLNYRSFIKENIKEKDSVLEIGTGWGGLSLLLVKEFGCNFKLFCKREVFIPLSSF